MRLLLIALLGVLAGCGGISGACTLIGCYSGLTVRAGNAPAGGWRIEAFVPGQPGRYTYDCAAGAPCEAFFTDFTPDQVTIRVVGAAGAREQTFTPAYTVSHPNGRECGPECRQGAVDFPAAP